MTQQIKDEQFWMHHAMQLAKKAEQQGEIPVGAVIVANNELVAEGWNQCITTNDPTAHAEIVAIRAAGEKLQNYRIVDTTLYVTLEPCPMCVGAIVHARIAKVVFGASDHKTGAVHSAMNLLEHESHNHKVEQQSGVCQQDCSSQLSAFFKKRRAEKKALKQQLSNQDES